MHPVFIAVLLAALVLGASPLLPERQAELVLGLEQAAARNFLVFRQAVENCKDAAGTDEAVTAETAEQCLPAGYLAMGDWQVLEEDDVLYVYGRDLYQEPWRLAYPDVAALAGASLRLGTAVSGTLSPAGTALPSSIPEESVVFVLSR